MLCFSVLFFLRHLEVKTRNDREEYQFLCVQEMETGDWRVPLVHFI